MKNVIIKALVKAARFFVRSHPVTTERRLLVVATTALGDTLWATPALESLRKSFPTAYIGVLTSRVGIQVLHGNPHVDVFYELPHPATLGVGMLWKKLWREKFDTILVFHASQRVVFPLCALLGATKVVGTKGMNKGLDALCTEVLEEKKEHEIVRRLRMVEAVGGKREVETMTLFLGVKERKGKRKHLLVALHPGSKDPFKRWPKKNFVELGKTLRKKTGCDILVTGSKGEEQLMHEVAREIPHASLCNTELPLKEFAALLNQVDLLVCNDTGPFHIACALGRPVVGLYAATDPVLCGPHRAPTAVTVAKPMSCTPCLKRKCPVSFCLLQIGTCEVLEASLKLLL